MRQPCGAVSLRCDAAQRDGAARPEWVMHSIECSAASVSRHYNISSLICLLQQCQQQAPHIAMSTSTTIRQSVNISLNLDAISTTCERQQFCSFFFDNICLDLFICSENCIWIRYSERDSNVETTLTAAQKSQWVDSSEDKMQTYQWHIAWLDHGCMFPRIRLLQSFLYKCRWVKNVKQFQCTTLSSLT